MGKQLWVGIRTSDDREMSFFFGAGGMGDVTRHIV